MLTIVDPHIERRFRDGLTAPLSWHPTEGGKRSFVCFEDELLEDLGPDPDGSKFNLIADRMLTGRYYPRDAVQFYGLFQDEDRQLRPGDRIQQRAPIFPFWDGLVAWSMAEIFVAEKSESTCSIGYVTTRKHHGRGIWRADLTHADGRLNLAVRSTASPNSFLYWLGIPVARYLQLRARRRAIEEFRKLLLAQVG